MGGIIMENIGWIIYLCGIADGIITFFAITGLLFAIVSIVYFFCWVDDGKGPYKMRFIIISAIAFLIAGLTPSTSTCYLIFGVTETAEYINSNDEIKKLPDNAVKALNYWLEEQTKEDKEK